MSSKARQINGTVSIYISVDCPRQIPINGIDCAELGELNGVHRFLYKRVFINWFICGIEKVCELSNNIFNKITTHRLIVYTWSWLLASSKHPDERNAFMGILKNNALKRAPGNNSISGHINYPGTHSNNYVLSEGIQVYPGEQWRRAIRSDVALSPNIQGQGETISSAGL